MYTLTPPCCRDVEFLAVRSLPLPARLKLRFLVSQTMTHLRFPCSQPHLQSGVVYPYTNYYIRVDGYQETLGLQVARRRHVNYLVTEIAPQSTYQSPLLTYVFQNIRIKTVTEGRCKGIRARSLHMLRRRCLQVPGTCTQIPPVESNSRARCGLVQHAKLFQNIICCFLGVARVCRLQRGCEQPSRCIFEMARY